MLMPRQDEMKAHALEVARQKWGPAGLQSLREHLAALASEQSTENDSERRRWFVLQCEPARERTAAAHLIGRRFKTYLPMLMVVRTRASHTAFGTHRYKQKVSVPMFPSYLFIRLDFELDQARLKFIHNAPGIRSGVHSFLKVNERPAVIDDRAMQVVQSIEEDGLKRKVPASSFKVKQEVKVTDGPFAGFHAVIKKIIRLEPEERISVLIDIFGRPTPMDLSADQIHSL